MSCLFASVVLCSATASSFFSDGMMLQRDRPVPVWGTAAPGERVEASFGGKSASATADAKGNWCVTLPAFPASDKGRDLKVGSRTFKNIIVGDVYIVGGQSNMQFPVCGHSARQHDAKGNALAQIVRASHAAKTYGRSHTMETTRRDPFRLSHGISRAMSARRRMCLWALWMSRGAAPS